MRDEGATPSESVEPAAVAATEEESSEREAAVVRVLCVDGEISRAIIGYGDSSAEAYRSAVAEARAFCRHHGGTQKITKL